MEDNNNMLVFDQPIGQSSYIKVIGVGGGGCNAVNHMCRQGINGVDFVVCNTDIKSLNASPVANKIVLGQLGLGAGNKSEKARMAAEQHADEIREMLSNNTNMLFITAGMGGGTGTGAAPVIAKIAKSIELKEEDIKRILVVAVVTTPFFWEGPKRMHQAEEGIKVLRETVDSMIVINNDKIRSLGGNMPLAEGFMHANNVLLEAVKGISDIITGGGTVNCDFMDVNTVMEGSGRALMGTGTGKGENRAKDAVVAASTSSLLNDSDISGAQDMLLYFYSNPAHEVTMDEMEDVSSYLRSICRNDDVNIIWGAGYDENLDDELHIILVATGIDPKRNQMPSPSFSINQSAAEQQHQASPTETIEGIEEPVLISSNQGEYTEANNPASNVRILPLYGNDNEQENVNNLNSQSTAHSQQSIELSQKPEAEQLTEPFIHKRSEASSLLDFVSNDTPKEDLSSTPATPNPQLSILDNVNLPQSADPINPQLSELDRVQLHANRVKRIYDLLHKNPDGVQYVEQMTTEQLTNEQICKTPPSSQHDAPKTKIGANGMVIPVNPYLYSGTD